MQVSEDAITVWCDDWNVWGVMRASNLNEAGEGGVTVSVVLKSSLWQKSMGKIGGGNERSQGDQLEGGSNKRDY